MTRKESLEKSIADLSEALDLDYLSDTSWCVGDPYEVLESMKRELTTHGTKYDYSTDYSTNLLRRDGSD